MYKNSFEKNIDILCDLCYNKDSKREAIIMMINLMFGAIIFKFFQMLIKF